MINTAILGDDGKFPTIDAPLRRRKRLLKQIFNVLNIPSQGTSDPTSLLNDQSRNVSVIMVSPNMAVKRELAHFKFCKVLTRYF
ncbi:hypothetical protein CEXT_674761 [Caerostris extrusa]|uniref:Uncharacterized protein n=1 Tax=Caerostris extrusa TaxID=172846 RepID=A0AAV4P1K1_CAEEX|nr:hypothetical protein CEXT_674761 [Caerostris extrusa]